MNKLHKFSCNMESGGYLDFLFGLVYRTRSSLFLADRDEPDRSSRCPALCHGRVLGSILGAPIGYILGKWLGKPILRKILPEKWTKLATEQFDKNGDAAVLIGSFTPIPFKVFTILSGVFNYSLTKLMLFAILGRGIKFYLIGILFHLYGKHAKVLLDEYLEIAVLGIGAVVAIAWLVWNKRRKKPLDCLLKSVCL